MNRILLLWAVLGISACAELVPQPPERSSGHITPDKEAAGEIPGVVEETPVLPAPQPAPEVEKYTVVVNEVPVKELLFALARDAKMNVDIHPSITGVVTLNAVDQTLPQILARLAEQVDLRYELRQNTIVLAPDTPYFRTYKVDFVNMARDTTHTVSVATQIDTATSGSVAGSSGGGGGGNNNSTTTVTSTSNQRLWASLVSNIMALTGEQPGPATSSDVPRSKSVVANPETGLIEVLATQKQHQKIQHFIDEVMASASRQVLVEATIVEVTLRDQYTAGIEWSKLARDAGFDILVASSTGTGFNPASLGQFFTFRYSDSETEEGSVDATLRLLDEFGNVQVLSSPKLMVLNNQTALLKVVENIVYFDVKAELGQITATGTQQATAFTTTPRTVPVGLVMSVTPQVSNIDEVTLNVRPTISEFIKFVPDPNPNLRFTSDGTPLPNPLENNVPQIAVREMESLLKVHSGQTAILGGLMKDSTSVSTQGVPWLSKIFPIGELFKHRDNDYTKTELVIFLRPTVIKNASLNADLKPYRQFLTPTPNLDVVSPIQSENR